MLVHPFYHSYNGGLINFNMVRWTGWSEDWITVLVASYSGVYVSIVSFFTILFLFRYWTMMRSQCLEFFKGWKIIILVSWSFIFGVIGGGVVLYFGWIDDYSRDYMRAVMLEHYDLDVDHVSGYTVIAYDSFGNLRWNAFGFSFGIIFLMDIQFAIVGYCGFHMHFKMNDMLKNVSEAHRRLQKQFFKSLVFQITSPTLTFYIPAVAILTVPFLNLEWSLPTGLIVCSFSIYPPIDSLILMLIVSDYRKAMKGIIKHPSNIFGTRPATTAIMVTSHAVTKSAWF
uniref:Seven TM Receptor n=1 Tax=Caenorhabditis tropicalis TaxID=1561998 RepID=A0A1I7T6H3_9PELO